MTDHLRHVPGMLSVSWHRADPVERHMSDVTTIITCHHPRCAKSIRFHELACPTHWHELPIPLRNRIWRTWKASDRAGHGRAVTEALAIWVANIEEAERPLRCHNCKAEALGTDETTSLTECLTCARAALGGRPVPQACTKCGAETGLLVSVDTGEGFGPDLCCDCQISMSEAG